MTTKKMSFVFLSLFAALFLANCSDDMLAGDSTPTYTLSTNASPVNGGGIVRNPDSRSYETGTTVTLTAEPNAGYLFAGWTGVPSGVNALSPEITLIMNRDLTVIAYFEAIPAHSVVYNGNTGGTSSSGLTKHGVKVYKIKETLFDTGIIEAQTPVGHTVRIYNAERTICDLLRNRRNIEIQDIQSAVKGYVRMRSKNIPQLMRYAKQFFVEKTVRRYLEVLL